MTKLAEQVLEILTSYIGPRMAHAIVHAAAAETRIDYEALELNNLPKLLDVVDRHIATSIHEANRREGCMRELRHAGPHMAPTPSLYALMIIPILREADVMRVRSVMRKLAAAQGFSEDRQAAVVASVVDLGTELLKRGLHGTLVFRKLGSPAGIEVTAFEGTKAPPGKELSTLQIKADSFDRESEPNMGTTIRVTWLKNPAP